MNALRHIAVRVLLASVIAAALAGAGWWFFVRDTAALATSAPAIPADLQETSTLSSVDSSGIVDYRVLSDRSDATLFADATLAGLTISSGATDATSDISGTLYLSSEGLTLDPSRYSVLTVGLSNLEIGGVATDTGVMATFTATEIDGYDPAIPEGEEQSLQLSGTLDLLGVDAPLTWNVKARVAGDALTVLATTSFNYTAFNIPALSLAGSVSVGDDVTLQVQLIALAA